MCTKDICDSAQPVGLGLGLMLGADEALKHANREPIFGPFLGTILNSVLLETQNSLMNTSRPAVKEISEGLNNLDSKGQEIQSIESIVEKFKASNVKGDITFEEFKELQEVLNTRKDSLITDNEEIKAQIKKHIED